MSSATLSLEREQWSAQFGRVPSLDGVRAVSVLLVLVGHMLLPSQFVGLSALGLKVFFFLSGFLISRLLLAEAASTGTISLGNFYIRRLIRLYPVILCYTAIVALITLYRNLPINSADVASVFLYFVNYQVIHYMHTGNSITIPVGMMWSLSIEEHFYLIAPLCIYLVGGNARRVLVLALAACALCLSLRFLYSVVSPGITNTLEIYWRSETRFDCIAYGVILACIPQLKGGQRVIEILSTRTAFILGSAGLLLSFLYRDNYYQMTWRFSLQGLALIPIVASVVYAAPIKIINQLLNSRLLVWIGALSYSLYIWHGGVSFLFERHLPSNPDFSWRLFELALALGLACISYYCLERPALRLRQLFGGKEDFMNRSVVTRDFNLVTGSSGSSDINKGHI